MSANPEFDGDNESVQEPREAAPVRRPDLGTGLLAPGIKANPPVVSAPVAAALIADDADPDDMRPIDAAEEADTTRPPNSPGRVRFLLKFETEAQRDARIRVDKLRWRRSCGL